MSQVSTKSRTIMTPTDSRLSEPNQASGPNLPVPREGSGRSHGSSTTRMSILAALADLETPGSQRTEATVILTDSRTDRPVPTGR